MQQLFTKMLWNYLSHKSSELDKKKEKKKYNFLHEILSTLRETQTLRFNFFQRETESGLTSNFSMNIIWLEDQNSVWNAVFDNVYDQ